MTTQELKQQAHKEFEREKIRKEKLEGAERLKREFWVMMNCKKCKCKKVRSSRGLVCPKHEIK